MKIARISTVPFFISTQLSQQIQTIKEQGFDVTIISSYGEELDYLVGSCGIRHVEVYIPRKIEIIADLKALIQLYLVFRRDRYDVVHSTTPKAGLLVAVAGFCSGIPVRMHTFTGQVWLNYSGLKRAIFKLIDKIVVMLDTHCYADGKSQTLLLREEGVIKSLDQIKVLGEGSIAGVDLDRFDRHHWSAQRKELLSEYTLSDERKKILFVGRITEDKGIVELLDAHASLIENGGEYDLLLVGTVELHSKKVFGCFQEALNRSDYVYHFDYTETPEQFFSIADVLCIPSYREGFGTVVIEAAALGVPAVGTNVTGLSDSIVDNSTGLLVPPFDFALLAKALSKILDDERMSSDYGESAYQRVLDKFDSKLINGYVVREYLDSLAGC